MFITYQITHKVSKKFYIGKTSLDNWINGYLGSGKLIKRAVKKYGKDSFYRAILNTFNTEQEAFQDEIRLLDEETLNNPLCYNIDTGGCGYLSGKSHPYYGISSVDHPTFGKPGHWKGVKRPDMSFRHTGKGNPRYGVKAPQSEDTKQAIRKTMTGVKHTPDRIAKIWLGKQKKQMQILDNPVKPALEKAYLQSMKG
ncbi:MAG: GIY-YIG nuclease family protein [Gammaproteobacteria bacterium]|nr:GIY-YIG nuclease family protein [Gammaproteobacteria bacterium]